MLSTSQARDLYFQHAAPQPVIDYHCHISPALIAADHRFADITELWLAGDHYKWRAMRANGVDERFITGDATPWERFHAFAATVPATLRNPLYTWTHMELQRPFGITGRLLNADSAQAIFDECNEKLAQPDFTARGIISKFNVEVICTTDDPADDLRHHRAIRADATFATSVLPSFRADALLPGDDVATYNAYLERLAGAANVEISSYPDLLEALARRMDYFHAEGCRLADVSLEAVPANAATPSDPARTFATLRGGVLPAQDTLRELRSALLHDLGVMIHHRGWVQQLHLGPLRNCNTRMRKHLGADAGFDCISDQPQARALARHLDSLDSTNQLARTIVYNLNPADNEMMAALIGCFQDGTMPGKMQLGSAWWFLDQRNGIQRQLDALSNLGLLSRFVGMLTDSRSLVSYSRHDYFRRILCELLGGEMATGLLPDDLQLVGQLVRDVCSCNARRYFGFERAAPPA